MIAQPGVIGGALDGKIQGDLEVMLAGGCHQPVEVRQITQQGVDGVVTALVAADGVGTAGVVRAGLQAVVRSLAVVPAYRMNRRKIQHIETHAGDVRQPSDDIGESALSVRITALRTGYQHIPTGKLRASALRTQPVATRASQMRPRAAE